MGETIDFFVCVFVSFINKFRNFKREKRCCMIAFNSFFFQFLTDIMISDLNESFFEFDDPIASL